MDNLEMRIMGDLKTAMKNKNQAALRGIRAIKAAILIQKTDGSGTELDEMGEIKLLQKLVKQRQDSLDIYEKQGRNDLATIERDEIEVIKKYLPKELSLDELKEMIGKIIKETGADSVKDMGKVMGIASKEAGGKADGKTIAGVVKEMLGS